MGIGLSDYNNDGRNDYYVTDRSLVGDQLTQGNPMEDIQMADLLQVNKTGDGDLVLETDGDELIQPNRDTGMMLPAMDQDLHGDVILPCWFSWGVVFCDFDNDGDPDCYICAKTGEANAGSAGHFMEPLADIQGAFDRFFENQLIQDPLAFADPIDKRAQFRDLNPEEYL
ncbi:MAG: hypothetical protein ACE5H3_02735, partial [Planctomycetota bacterium]